MGSLPTSPLSTVRKVMTLMRSEHSKCQAPVLPSSVSCRIVLHCPRTWLAATKRQSEKILQDQDTFKHFGSVTVEPMSVDLSWDNTPAKMTTIDVTTASPSWALSSASTPGHSARRRQRSTRVRPGHYSIAKRWSIRLTGN